MSGEGEIVDVMRNASTPNIVKNLNLGFKNIRDFTFLPNYKNLVRNCDEGRDRHIR